jgi:hypothetical protein
MKKHSSIFVVILVVALLCLAIGWGLGIKSGQVNGIPVRTVADYLHAVIEADRTFYTQHVVERMEAMLIVTASEQWRENQTLPLPVQFLREASRSLHVRNAPFRYRLISLWPLNPNNATSSEQERKALAQVVEYGEVVGSEVEIDQTRYYKAIYPDRAISRACASCHNSHPQSPKRDFKLNDVMGGLVIQVPID